MASNSTAKRAASTAPSLNSQLPYSFLGSNSSHSHDNGTGGRTYHIPNYATRYEKRSTQRTRQTISSYANDRTNLISVTFDEDRGSQRITIIFILAILFITAVPTWMGVPSLSQHYGPFKTTERHSGESNGSSDLDSPLDHARTIDVQQSQVNKHQLQSQDKTSWNVTWSKPEVSQTCHGFGTRQYTANLVNLPFFASWEDACRNTPVVIGGATYIHPSACEKGWLFGRVKGRWIVKSEDEVCLPHWGTPKDKGCSSAGSQRRHFEARLLRLKDGENRMALCWTTPIFIHGRPVPKPASCREGIWGVYGVWDVEDAAC
ncbi:hypothetical protein CPB83DRAFT_842917 [Crepidotus variabilis]|uniref:Uncharacterized protein n=1 Tax=Crepidotus variabilis TaxID=179855 RepID=A0A9P6JWM7_9AGAR|nr:hypothetical protein CPB83DRAFT_842917 [Crepidotus variabilis]